MKIARWEALIAYATRARERLTFDSEEVDYRLAVADGLRHVLELAAQGKPWFAELDKFAKSQLAGRPFDFSQEAHIAWLKRLAETDEAGIGLELGRFLDPQADPVVEFARFSGVLERIRIEAGIPAHEAAVVNCGSLFAFAGSPRRCPALRPELLAELVWTLGFAWTHEAPAAEQYERLSSFVGDLSERLRSSGIDVRDTIDAESLITLAARDLDFWAADARAPLALKPSREARKPYLSVCAIYRDEAPYLAEWIEFHRLVGVERFFLYNNLSEDNHTEVLAPYVDEGIVVLYNFPAFPGQVFAYIDCLRWHREDSRWIAFIDLDEFLFSPTGRKVSTVLGEYERWPAVAVNWAVFGTGGHRTRPEGLVIENYLHRLDIPANRHIKSIVDPVRVSRPVDPHYFRYPYLGAVDENHNPVEERPATRSVSFKRLRINHYHSKSEEEFQAKYQRARAGGVPRTLGNIGLMREYEKRESRLDEALLAYAPKVRASLGESQRKPG